MTDYTPTTEVIRHAVAFPRERLGEPRPIKPEAFNRWLNEIRAEAWEEGFSAGVDLGMAVAETMMKIKPSPPPSVPDNPYRQEKK